MATRFEGWSESPGGRPRGPALLTLLLGLALTCLATWLQGRSNDARRAREFDALAEATAGRLFERLRRYEYGLRGARGSVLAAGREGITRRIFRVYHESRDIDVEFPGTRGFGFIRRVPAAREAAFLAAARRDGAPDFALRQLSPSGHERYVIQYIEPIERNHLALGLDIASEVHRRSAADMALRTGKTAITRPITLVQTPEAPLQGFLLLLPIYEPGMRQGTEADREAAGFGWSYAALVITEVLRDLHLGDDSYTLSIADIDAEGGPPELFHGSAEPAAPDALVRRIVQPVFGRAWQVELRAEAPFFARLDLLRPSAVFATGGLMSALLAALVHAYRLSRKRAHQLVADQLRIATILENSSDAIVAEDLRGTITGWNRAAERLFGYTAEEALGRPSSALIPAVTSHRHEESTVAFVRTGQPVHPFDQVCRRRDGSLVEISITVSPITASDGSVVGLGKTIRDIGARKDLERQLQTFNSRLEQQVGERTAQLEAARRDLQTILDAMPSMIGYWDAALRCRFANTAYTRWFGVDAESLPGRTMRDVLGEQLFAANQSHVEGALRGEPQAFERAIPHRDGHVRHALANYIPDVVDGEVRGFYVLVHDVTELTHSRQRLAAAIRENEALLRTIRSHVLYSVADRSGRIVDVNEVFCRTSGYERAELIGHTPDLLRSEVHGPEFMAEMWATVEAGRAWRGEVCNRAKDGSLFWADTVLAPFFGEDGGIEKFVAILVDITASKTAARELAEERQRLDNILRGTNVGTWEWNVQTGEARFNERWAELIGYSLDELAPINIDTWVKYTHPDDLVIAGELLARHFSGELDSYECEARMRHRDGHWVWVLDRGRVSTWTAEGKPESMHGTHLDITRRKEAQRRLAASEAFLARAERLARVGGWQLDLESGEFTWTSEARRLFEVGPDHRPTQASTVEFYAPEARAQIAAAMRGVVERGESFDLELPLVTATGRRIWVRTIGEPEYATEDGETRLVRLIGAVQDVTARRAADDALRDATRAAEAANAAKSEFLANMSHEIRTPLHAVLGLSSLLDRSPLDAEQRHFVTAIRLAGQGLLAIINDVLDLAKIETGNVCLDVEPFALRPLLDELLVVLKPQANARGLALTLEMPTALPPVLLGDAVRVRQILTNLLGNALKFTEQGGVHLGVAVLSRTPEQLRVRFTVRDTGVGIAPEMLARLFRPFVQADASTTRRFGGTGLGLSIVRHLAEMMGGEVGVQGELGRGSEFWVVLPLGLPAWTSASERAPELAPGAGEPRLARIRVLVVDDNEINCEVARRILAIEGALITTRGDGQEALDLLRAAPDAFDVVLMDIQMPGMDGNEATSRIRGELGLAELPVIALTAGALVAERKRALDAGMSDFVSKPLDPEMLVRLVRRHFDARPRDPPPPSSR